MILYIYMKYAGKEIVRNSVLLFLRLLDFPSSYSLVGMLLPTNSFMIMDG